VRLDAPSDPDAPAPRTWRSEAWLLWAQALPSIGMTVGRLAIEVIDFAMVSRLGTIAQAAITPATFLLMVVSCVGMAIAATVTTFAAQAFGRGERREASAYAWQSIYLALITLPLCWPLMESMRPFFGLFKEHAPEVREMEVAFCRIAVWCVAPAIAVNGLNGFFVGVQKPMVGFFAMMAALAWCIAGNYALVFGHWGFPTMGIRGSAYATVGAWVIRAAIMFAVFLKPQYQQEFLTRDAWRPSASRFGGLIRIGAPSALQWLLDIGAWFMFLTYLIAHFGTATMAAANVCWQYMKVAFMPALGVGMAVCSLVGHAIGERRLDLARLRVRIALVMVSAYMGAAGLLFIVAPRPLMKLFSAGNPEVIAIGAAMMVYVGFFQLFDGLFHVYNNALRGAGDTRFPAEAVIVTSWGVFFCGGWAAVHWLPRLNYHGPWIACTLYMILLGMALWLRWERGAWEKIDLFAPRRRKAAEQPAPVSE